MKFRDVEVKFCLRDDHYCVKAQGKQYEDGSFFFESEEIVGKVCRRLSCDVSDLEPPLKQLDWQDYRRECYTIISKEEWAKDKAEETRIRCERDRLRRKELFLTLKEEFEPERNRGGYSENSE